MFRYAALGIIQGITEFLPISSSGHLVVFKHLFGLQGPDNALLEALLHFGTLIAVLIVFRGKIKRLIVGVFSGSTEERRYLLYLIIATVPIGVVGLLAQDFVEAAFGSIRSAGIGLLITGSFLWPLRLKSGSPREDEDFNWKDALIIGIAQVAALFPGISRSGVTISTGLFKDLDPDQVAEFSFLLMVPAVLGANILQGWEGFVGNSGASLPLLAYGIGTLAAGISGVIAIKWLLNLIRKGELTRFSYYCLSVGGAVLIWSFV